MISRLKQSRLETECDADAGGYCVVKRTNCKYLFKDDCSFYREYLAQFNLQGIEKKTK